MIISLTRAGHPVSGESFTVSCETDTDFYTQPCGNLVTDANGIIKYVHYDICDGMGALIVENRVVMTRQHC